jgi:hypothetical protein
MIFTWVSGLIAERLTDETFLDDNSPPIDAVGEAVVPVCSSPFRRFLGVSISVDYFRL